MLSYDLLSPNDKSFVMTVGVVEEPKHYHEATRKPEWQQAMQQELQALEQNNA